MRNCRRRVGARGVNARQHIRVDRLFFVAPEGD
jgi:hypothetical protein